MARYRNGRIPDSQLVWFWALNQYGKRERFRATPATAARLTAFITDVKAGTGVQLYITSGPNVYRDYNQQVAMRAKYAALGKPTQAAVPGTSSHGGEYKGSDSLAADIYNYNAIPWATFVKYAKKHGLRTNFVTPTEYWHVGDFNPYTNPSTGGTGATMTSAKDVWYFPVHRDGKEIRAIQELADIKTIALDLQLRLATDVTRGGKKISVRQDNADTNTFVREVLEIVKKLDKRLAAVEKKLK